MTTPTGVAPAKSPTPAAVTSPPPAFGHAGPAPSPSPSPHTAETGHDLAIEPQVLTESYGARIVAVERLTLHARCGEVSGFRGTSLAIAIGIPYTLMIERLVNALASQVSAIERLAEVLPRANAYSLSAVLGAMADSSRRNGPGSLSGPYVDAWQPALVLAGCAGVATAVPRSFSAVATLPEVRWQGD